LEQFIQIVGEMVIRSVFAKII